MNDTIIYYIMKENKIFDIKINNKQKAEELLSKLQKDLDENNWLPIKIIECKPTKSNKLINGYNYIRTITLNEEPLYTIINNEFTAIQIYNKLQSSNNSDEWVRNYKIRTDIINYEME